MMKFWQDLLINLISILLVGGIILPDIGDAFPYQAGWPKEFTERISSSPVIVDLDQAGSDSGPALWIHCNGLQEDKGAQSKAT